MRTTKRRENKNKNTAPVLEGETPEVTTKGETGLSVVEPENVSDASPVEAESTPVEAESTSVEAESTSDDTSLVVDDDDDDDDDTESSEGDPTNPAFEGTAGSVTKKTKQKRQMAVEEIVQCFSKGGVAAIKKFAVDNDRTVTAAPLERTLNTIKLMGFDEKTYTEKYGELIAFHLEIASSQGAGRGKRPTYSTDGSASQFKVQRPTNAKTKKKRPMMVLPLRVLKMNAAQEFVWSRFFENEAMVIVSKVKSPTISVKALKDAGFTVTE